MRDHSALASTFVELSSVTGAFEWHRQRLGDGEARSVYELFCECSSSVLARHLPELPQNPDELDARQTLLLIAAVLNERLHYDDKIVPVQGGGGSLLLRSCLALLHRRDFLSPLRLTKRILRRGASGVCSDFVDTAQVIYWSIQRATSRYPHAHIVPISGLARFTDAAFHRWCWLVDLDSSNVLTADISGAASDLDQGLDATSTNISSFLSTLWRGYQSEGARLYRSDAVRSVLADTLGPATAWNQALLLNILRQGALHPDVRSRLIRNMQLRGIDDAVMNWRLVLESAQSAGEPLASAMKAIWHNADAQHDILDAFGMAR